MTIKPIDFTESDVDAMARTLYGEARGEPEAGQIAVAWVIRNRVTTDLRGDKKPDWWGEGVQGVCVNPSQFSCWRTDDPNRAKMLALREENDAMFRKLK